MKNKHIFKVIFTMIITTIFSVSLLFSGTTGKIKGIVTDASNGEPLIGCNVIISGTSYGAASSMDGSYMILNIPPGNYDIMFSMIGYQKLMVKNVNVSIDFTTQLNNELPIKAIAGEMITVVAKKPMIRKDLTSTTAVVGAEEMESLPITEVSDVLEMQAGYVDGSLRGGRKGEIAYLVDGIPITDSYDRSATVSVNKNMVQELQLISGAFNAEYGNVMSGVVNITTKRGNNNFGGTFESYVGDNLSSHNDIFGNIDDFNPTSTYNFETSLHGALIKDRIFYYLNARHVYFAGWQQGQNRYEPNSLLYYNENANEYAVYDSSTMGDNKWVDMNWNRKNYMQGQLIFKLSPKMNLNYNIFYDDKDYQDYDRAYKYTPNGILNKNLTGITQILKFQHQLSQKTYYNLAFSSNNRTYKGQLSDKISYNDSTIYIHPDYTTAEAYQFNVGGTDNNQEERISKSYLGKFSITSQINKKHQIKTGIQYKYNDINWKNFSIRPSTGENAIDISALPADDSTFSPYIHPQIFDDSTIYSSSYQHNPIEFSCFIQDKMEYDELIVNLGVRFDYFDPDAVILADPSDPQIYSPMKPQNRYHDTNDNGIQDNGETDVTLEERKSYWYKNASTKYKISPRIGISFPISDRGVFHFSYGHFFQFPNYYYLYENPEFDLGSGTGNIGLIGNADLEPEKTIVGEIGVQQQLTDDFAIDITIFLKDVRDLTGTRAEEIVIFGGSASYTKYVNSDFGVIKGITLSLNQKSSSGFYANVDYTFQIAKGTASDPAAYRNAVTGGSQPEIFLNPLDWDQRHTINLITGFNSKTYGFNFISRFGSGLPYTPRSTIDITSLSTNSQSKPSTFNVDVRAYYKIKLMGLKTELFCRINNLFDIKNETSVYDDTGRAGFTTDEERVEALNVPTPVNSIHEYYTNATHYSEPRRIEMGIKIGF
ncbi:MAG: TonB-dependent receptor [Candidatus Marinimicrobia bacterium]|nr:TonB-dependent receptor [Candidatus Neomarinimicrobiota bacterium]